MHGFITLLDVTSYDKKLTYATRNKKLLYLTVVAPGFQWSH